MARPQSRTRLTIGCAALLVGAVTSACGGGSDGAPTDASKEDFCATQSDLFKNLMPTDMSNPEVPSGEAMAKAFKGWATDLEEVGTPEDISDDARAGFEALIEQVGDINPDDFTIDKLEELSKGGTDASKATEKEATAFADYLTKTCGNPLDDLEMPEMPDSN